MDTDGAEGPGWLARAVRQHQFGLGEHYVADHAAVLFHHEVQLRDEVRMAAILIQHKMLRASGAINVPECLPREVLHLAVIGRGFKSYFHIFLIVQR